MDNTNNSAAPETFLDVAQVGMGFITFRISGPSHAPGEVIGRIGSHMNKRAAFKAARAEAALTGEVVTFGGRTI